jgi:hypothetical protein
VGDAVLLHAGKNVGEGARQVEGLLRGERTLFEHHFHPGRAFDPGHEDGVGQVGFAAQQVGVALGGEHGAAADGQAGQVGEGGEFLGLRDEGRRAEAGAEDFERRRLKACATVGGE